jgi:hypothetical protein
MNILWFPLLLLVLFASPVSAQTAAVRLKINTESWLGTTPIDLMAEVIAKLREANIEVTDQFDAPLVTVNYVESAGPGYEPHLVPGTRIDFDISVTQRGRGFYSSGSVSPRLEKHDDNFPSAAELRARTIEAFRSHETFSIAGHLVGVALGLESSFRNLIYGRVAHPRTTYPRASLFSGLQWTPENDDLFEEALKQIARSQPRSTEWLESFLQKQLPVIQMPDSPAMKSTLAAIAVLADYAGPSAVETLKIMAGPVFDPPIADAAAHALEKITTRLSAK